MNAKTRLTEKLKTYINEKIYGGVADQQNAIFAINVLERIEQLNLVQAELTERNIKKVEVPNRFGPVVVSPTDYLQFIPQ